jgi:hypothetical protein
LRKKTAPVAAMTHVFAALRKTRKRLPIKELRTWSDRTKSAGRGGLCGRSGASSDQAAGDSTVSERQRTWQICLNVSTPTSHRRHAAQPASMAPSG